VDAVDRLVAERECVALSHRYGRFADLGEAGRLAEVFASEGEFVTPDLHLRGRSEIAAWFRRRQALTDLQTVHLCTNIDIELEGPDRARGWVYLCLFRRFREGAGPVPRTQPALVGVYEDRYVREEGTWLIAERRQQVMFADPEDTGWVRPDR
jgi:hypothetical protein